MCLYTHMICVYLQLNIYQQIYMYIHVCVCACVCLFICAHIERPSANLAAVPVSWTRGLFETFWGVLENLLGAAWMHLLCLFGVSWGPAGCLRGHLWGEGFRMSVRAPPLGPHLGARSWPSWRPPGPSWGPLGVLGPSFLGAPWAALWRSWGP